MSEAVGSVRETTKTKNSNSGNLKSVSGILNFTTTTQNNQTVTTYQTVSTSANLSDNGNFDTAKSVNFTLTTVTRLRAFLNCDYGNGVRMDNGSPGSLATGTVYDQSIKYQLNTISESNTFSTQSVANISTQASTLLGGAVANYNGGGYMKISARWTDTTTTVVTNTISSSTSLA